MLNFFLYIALHQICKVDGAHVPTPAPPTAAPAVAPTSGQVPSTAAPTVAATQTSIVWMGLGNGWCRPADCIRETKSCRTNGYYKDGITAANCRVLSDSDVNSIGYAATPPTSKFPNRCFLYATAYGERPSVDWTDYPQPYYDIGQVSGLADGVSVEDSPKCYAKQSLSIEIRDPSSVEIPRVVMSATFGNIDYGSLISDVTLSMAFLGALKTTIANATGSAVMAHHVNIILSFGSVRMDSTIIPPGDVSVEAVASTMLSSSSSFGLALVESVEAVPGIETVSYGNIFLRNWDAPTAIPGSDPGQQATPSASPTATASTNDTRNGTDCCAAGVEPDCCYKLLGDRPTTTGQPLVLGVSLSDLLLIIAAATLCFTVPFCVFLCGWRCVCNHIIPKEQDFARQETPDSVKSVPPQDVERAQPVRKTATYAGHICPQTQLEGCMKTNTTQVMACKVQVMSGEGLFRRPVELEPWPAVKPDLESGLPDFNSDFMKPDLESGFNSDSVKPDLESGRLLQTGGTQAAVLTVAFEPGEVGFMLADSKCGSVTGVDEGMQAHRLGVRGGMRLLTVEGRLFTKDRYLAAKSGTESYKVTFAQAINLGVDTDSIDSPQLVASMQALRKTLPQLQYDEHQSDNPDSLHVGVPSDGPPACLVWPSSSGFSSFSPGKVVTQLTQGTGSSGPFAEGTDSSGDADNSPRLGDSSPRNLGFDQCLRL